VAARKTAAVGSRTWEKGYFGTLLLAVHLLELELPRIRHSGPQALIQRVPGAPPVLGRGPSESF
jgi:hypothetical protein